VFALSNKKYKFDFSKKIILRFFTFQIYFAVFGWSAKFILRFLVGVQNLFCVSNTLKNGIFPGDILLGTIGATIGNVCLFPSFIEKAVLSISVCKITPNNLIINRIYLSHYLFLLKDEMIKQTLGSIVPVLKIGTLKELKISLPPLALQEKFAVLMQNVDIFRPHLEQSEQACNILIFQLFK